MDIQMNKKNTHIDYADFGVDPDLADW